MAFSFPSRQVTGLRPYAIRGTERERVTEEFDMKPIDVIVEKRLLAKWMHVSSCSYSTV